jgi:hypothetical protein
MACDQGGEPINHVLVERGSGINAVGSHFVEKRTGEVIQWVHRL